MQGVYFLHMDNIDTHSLPETRDGLPGGLKATTKLRDHGFKRKRDRNKPRPYPSAETKERAAWIYWLADSCGYDFDHFDGDIAPEHSFKVWRAARSAEKVRRTLEKPKNRGTLLG